MDRPAGDAQRASRALNERTVGSLERRGRNVTAACECGEPGCSQLLTLGGPLFRKIRRHETWFLVASGHEVNGSDRVMLRQPTFVVVDVS